MLSDPSISEGRQKRTGIFKTVFLTHSNPRGILSKKIFYHDKLKAFAIAAFMHLLLLVAFAFIYVNQAPSSAPSLSVSYVSTPSPTINKPAYRTAPFSPQQTASSQEKRRDILAIEDISSPDYSFSFEEEYEADLFLDEEFSSFGLKENFGRKVFGARFRNFTIKGKMIPILDISGSMRNDLPIILKQIQEKFPRSPILFVVGCELSTPADRRSTHGAPAARAVSSSLTSHYVKQLFEELQMPLERDTLYENTLRAVRAAVNKHDAKTIWWYCDLQDQQTKRGLSKLQKLLDKKNILFHIESLNREANKELTAIVQKTGGKILVRPLLRQSFPPVPVSDL